MSDLERDKQNISRVQAGDTEAFGSIYAEQFPNVLAYTNRRVAQPEDAEDLAQDVFVKVFEAVKRGRYRDQGKPFSSYVNTVSARVRFDHYRANARSHTIPLEEVVQIPADNVGTPESSLEKHLQREALKRGLVQLTPYQRQAVEGRYLLEMDYPEMAATFQRTEGSIRVAVMRGIKHLRTFLQNDFESR